MHNGELAKKYQVSPAFNTKRMSSETRCIRTYKANVFALRIWLIN